MIPPEIADEICAEIAAGRSLNSLIGPPSIGRRPARWPELTTWYREIARDDDLRKKYTRAKEDQADTLADQILEVAESAPERVTVEIGEDSRKTHVDSGAEQHRRTRIDALKWIASKLKPKKYGDRHAVEHSGAIDLGLADRLAKAAQRSAQGGPRGPADIDAG